MVGRWHDSGLRQGRLVFTLNATTAGTCSMPVQIGGDFTRRTCDCQGCDLDREGVEVRRPSSEVRGSGFEVRGRALDVRDAALLRAAAFGAPPPPFGGNTFRTSGRFSIVTR